MEAEGAEHRAHDERRDRVVGRDRRDRRRDRGAVAGRAGQGGSRAAEVLGSLRADTDQQHHLEARVVSDAERHGDRGHLADLAGRTGHLEDPDQVDAQEVGQIGRAGTQQRRRTVLTRKDRQRHGIDPDHAVRRRRAQREVGR